MVVVCYILDANIVKRMAFIYCNLPITKGGSCDLTETSPKPLNRRLLPTLGCGYPGHFVVNIKSP